MYLPWKEHHNLLPDNYENSVARLSSYLKRLRRDTEILKEYDSIIHDELQSGVIERVDTPKCPNVGKYSSDPEFVENILNSFYVDDLVSGEGDLEKCLSLYQRSKKCLSEGGFNLRKSISNSPKLLDLIHEDCTKTEGGSSEQRPVVEDTETYTRTTVGHLEELDMKNEHKILGLNWNWYELEL